MALPLLIILSIVGAYTLVLLLFSSGIQKEESYADREPAHGSKVSVIIPFRNEEQNLPLLIHDLKVQTYPPGLFEVILVNDHSTDGSGEIVKSMVAGIPGFRQLGLLPGNSGKKAALSHGIQSASHERLIQVDADCRIGPEFIASHMAFLEKHPSDLVAGLVSTGQGKGGFLEVFERLELLALAGTGAGSFRTGRPMMCSGANLAYSRELYMETRSYDPAESTESGDDMFLMIGARKLKRVLAFNLDREACVHTAPVLSFRDLLKQRIRWGAKSTRYGMADIQLLALLVAVTNLSVLLMPLWFILFPGNWQWLAGTCLMKSVADFVLLYLISGICHQRSNLRWFIPVSLVYYPVFFLSLLGMVSGRQSWKRGG